MSVICPRCGKENTIPFSDSVYHTHGYECEDCKKDFAVDDGKKIKEWENDLLSFEYERVYKNQTKKRILIQVDEKENKVMLTPSIVYPDKKLQPIESQDLTAFYPSLKVLLFEKLFILDWNRINVGLILGQDESFSIKMKFRTKPEITFSGTNRFPPYFKVLEDLFAFFFELQ